MSIWQGVTDRVNAEPVMTMWLIQTAIAMAILFGLDWSAEQTTAVIVFIAAVLSWIARSKVSPV